MCEFYMSFHRRSYNHGNSLQYPFYTIWGSADGGHKLRTAFQCLAQPTGSSTVQLIRSPEPLFWYPIT